jgi:DNA modification methylase
MSSVNYIIGDSRKIVEIFKKSNNKHPELIITSPPYHDIKNYENSEKQIGFGQSFIDYQNDITDVLHQCYRISSENSTLWLILDNIRKDGELIPLPFELIDHLKMKYQKTWILKDIIIWSKQKNIPWHHKGILKNHFEYILFLTKNDDFKFKIDRIREIADLKKWWISYPERYNPNGKVPTNIWEFNSPIRGWGNGCQKHFCPFPFPLVEKIISITSDVGDLVLDPFAGSGSVLALSKVMNRESIGIDINSKYKKRFEDEVLPGAKKYWEHREVELKKIKHNIRKFNELNNKLRKIKFSLKVHSILLSDPHLKNFKFIWLTKKGKRNNIIKLAIISNQHISESKRKIGKESFNEIEQLTRLFKLKFEYEFSNLKQLKNIYSEINEFYEYTNKVHNKYYDKIESDNMIYSKLKSESIYSNINLSITREMEFFNKNF